jgi:hypothetical protein
MALSSWRRVSHSSTSTVPVRDLLALIANLDIRNASQRGRAARRFLFQSLTVLLTAQASSHTGALPSMSKPIRLSDSELAAVMAAARPLAVDVRDAFLQAVADALAGCAEVGPGVVYRVIAETQRKFFDPPDLRDEGVPRSRAYIR